MHFLHTVCDSKQLFLWTKNQPNFQTFVKCHKVIPIYLFKDHLKESVTETVLWAKQALLVDTVHCKKAHF